MREFLNSFTKLEFDKVKQHIQRYCSSVLGKGHLDALAPSTDLREIRYNLALVSEGKLLMEGGHNPPLENLPDVGSSINKTKIENYNLRADELHKIGLMLETAGQTARFFTKKKDDCPLLHAVCSSIAVNKVLQFNIAQTIDDNGAVRDSASKELASIRKQLVEKSISLRNRLEQILKTVAGKEWAQEEIITTREGRMVIPVKSEHKNHVPGFIHSSSSSGATVYIEPTETLEFNNDIRILQFQEQREIDKILKDLTEQVREARDDLLNNLETLGKLDFILAKSKYSTEILGEEVLIVDKGPVHLQNSRHPLLFLKHRRDDVVPLSIEFGGEFKTVVITGPNAGGKTVALKTVGLLSLMAQSGIHIPAAKDSQLPVFVEVFVDMGDEQSIENDLSSFSSHLANLKVILENCSPASLVLIDEIGSGTDPIEGGSLAAALLEKLTEIGCSTIATTHHSSLKSFAHNKQGMQNASMEYDQAKLSPTYKFRLGVPGSSYAIEMAERMDLPAEMIERAKEYRGSDFQKLDKLIIDLEQKTQAVTEELAVALQQREKLDSLVILYDTKLSSLNSELKQIKGKALDEAQQLLQKANTGIEQAVREIREKGAESQTIRKVKSDITKLKAEVEVTKASLETKPTIDVAFQKGDSVRLRSNNAQGEVLQRIDERHYLVIVGDVKLRLDVSELEATKDTARGASRSLVTIEASEIKREVDLRGLYGDEAIDRIDKFLDDALLAGLHRVDIIHGKGTGALRKRVGEYLKKHKSVKSFRLGEWNEGGTGVTVVELE